MTPRTPADWSLPAASFSAPVLGSDQSACPASGNYILISRSSCPTNGVHFKVLLPGVQHAKDDDPFIDGLVRILVGEVTE